MISKFQSMIKVLLTEIGRKICEERCEPSFEHTVFKQSVALVFGLLYESETTEEAQVERVLGITFTSGR